MKIINALHGVQRLYIETAPIIYYVEDHAVYADKMEQIFNFINANGIEVVTSVITLAETLTKPLKTGDKAVEQAYRNLLRQTQQITLVPITASIAEKTADFRARYNLRTPDALHVAAAIDTHANGFLTNDLTLRRITELSVLVLDNLELN